jgi:hypothetical protein
MTYTRSRSIRPLAWFLVLLLPAAAGAAEVQGYGPWKFGMKPAEVEAVTQYGPYTPVQSTGGLETMNGDFGGQKTPISFIFRPAGLHHIQIWAYSGQSYDEALAAFHRTYRYLVDSFGPINSTGGRIPSDLNAQQLGAKAGPEFSEAQESLLPKLKQLGSIQAHTMIYRIAPVSLPTAGIDVHADLVRSPEVGVYLVFLYFRSPTLGKM